MCSSPLIIKTSQGDRAMFEEEEAGAAPLREWDGVAEPGLRVLSSKTTFQAPSLTALRCVRILAPGQHLALPGGYHSLPPGSTCLFPWDKTGVNVEASEDSGEQGGWKEAMVGHVPPAGPCPLRLWGNAGAAEQGSARASHLLGALNSTPSPPTSARDLVLF